MLYGLFFCVVVFWGVVCFGLLVEVVCVGVVLDVGFESGFGGILLWVCDFEGVVDWCDLFCCIVVGLELFFCMGE